MTVVPDPNDLAVTDHEGVLIGVVVVLAVTLAVVLVIVVKTFGAARRIDKQVNNVPDDHPSIQAQLGVLGEKLTDVQERQVAFEKRWGVGGGGMGDDEFNDAAALQEFLHHLKAQQDKLEDVLEGHGTGIRQNGEALAAHAAALTRHITEEKTTLGEIQARLSEHDEWERTVKYPGGAA